LFGCGESAIQLQITVPNGYRGILKIYQNQTDGIVIPIKSGKIELNFDSRGILRLRGETPSLRWHTTSARYADGTEIPVIEFPAETPATKFGLRGFGGVKNDEDWYVIGTLDDVKAAQELRDGFKWPPK
jgi:hypothetical protein